jgi:S-formylglutathione hydrolase FrmB
MRKTLSIPFIILLYLLSALLPAGLGGCGQKEDPVPEDTVFVRHLQGQVLESNILNRNIKYEVFLPAGYKTSGISYPVVYLLHGFGENETSWYSGGRLYYYSSLYAPVSGDMIFVMPEGFNSYFVNKFNGRFNYMDMFTRELVPAIDSIYRTVPDNTHRAVMGYSMGGYGALILPALNPDIFSISVPLSMSFRTDEQYLAEPGSVFDYQWGSVFGGSQSDRFTDYFQQNSPFHFFADEDLTRYSGLKFFIDCGDDEESLSFTSNSLHSLMRDKNIRHEYRMRDGAHTWDYWRDALPEALTFIGAAFRGEEYPEGPFNTQTGPELPGSNTQIMNMPELGAEAGIMLPPSYDPGFSGYPVIYYIHDFHNGDRENERLKLFSLLYNSMAGSKIPKSIVVEFPVPASGKPADFLGDIISKTELEYPCLKNQENKLIIGNGAGGETAALIASEDTAIAGSCWIFEASLYPQTSPAGSGIFYFLDSADESSAYASYEKFYTELRKGNIPYECRVRQGNDSFDTFLSGVDDALPFIKKWLKT